MNFTPAVAYHVGLNMPAVFMQPGADLCAADNSQAQRQMCFVSYVLGLIGVAMNRQYSMKVLSLLLGLEILLPMGWVTLGN